MRKSELKQLENNVKTEFINAGNELIGKDLRLVEEAVRVTVKLLNIADVMAMLPSDKEIEAEASSYDNSMSSIAEGVWMPEGVRAGVKWVKHYMLKKVIGN